MVQIRAYDEDGQDVISKGADAAKCSWQVVRMLIFVALI